MSNLIVIDRTYNSSDDWTEETEGNNSTGKITKTSPDIVSSPTGTTIESYMIGISSVYVSYGASGGIVEAPVESLGYGVQGDIQVGDSLTFTPYLKLSSHADNTGKKIDELNLILTISIILVYN